jgi:hypothetical protein
MPKATLLLAAIFLVSCSHEDRSQTAEDARKFGRDLKKDAKHADVVVTKEMKDARERLKQDIDSAKK